MRTLSGAKTMEEKKKEKMLSIQVRVRLTQNPIAKTLRPPLWKKISKHVLPHAAVEEANCQASDPKGLSAIFSISADSSSASSDGSEEEEEEEEKAKQPPPAAGAQKRSASRTHHHHSLSLLNLAPCHPETTSSQEPIRFVFCTPHTKARSTLRRCECNTRHPISKPAPVASTPTPIRAPPPASAPAPAPAPTPAPISREPKRTPSSESEEEVSDDASESFSDSSESSSAEEGSGSEEGKRRRKT